MMFESTTDSSTNQPAWNYWKPTELFAPLGILQPFLACRKVKQISQDWKLLGTRGQKQRGVLVSRVEIDYQTETEQNNKLIGIIQCHGEIGGSWAIWNGAKDLYITE